MHSRIEYNVFASIDVDKKKLVCAFLDHQRVVGKMTFPYDPANLLNYVRKRFSGQKIAFVYEAGPTGYGIYDYLQSAGEECKVAVPSMIPRAPGDRVKTNKRDAVSQGEAFRGGNLKFVEIPSRRYRNLRHLTHLRHVYSKRLSGVKNRIKGLYLFENLVFPEGKWSNRLLQQLQDQARLNPEIGFVIKQDLEDLQYYRRQTLLTLAEVRRYCRSDEELSRCMQSMLSLPGIGWIVGSYILARLGGWRQLKSVKKTSHFFGLAPREHSTGEKVRRGRITAIGDPVARAMIIQSAWIAHKRDAQLSQIFQKVCSRNPGRYAKQKAIVAVARALVARIHAVLRDQRSFVVC